MALPGNTQERIVVTFVMRIIWQSEPRSFSAGLALVIFSLWNPGFAIAGSLIFALFYQLPKFISSSGAAAQIISLIPYFVTIVVLIVVSLFNKRETQPPASLGVNYFREDR